MSSFEILKIAANAINSKKGRDINALKVNDLTFLCEYFLICSGGSSTQVRALADEVEEKLKEVGVMPHHIEGKASGWIALDYKSVVIHIFGYKEREFYALDKMWADAEKIELETILEETMGD